MNIHLDFLANFPLNKSANALLFEDSYPKPNIFDNAFVRDLKADSAHLSAMFNKTHAHSFDYSCGEFLCLFSTLFSHHYHIVLAPSFSQQSFYAAHTFQTMHKDGLSFMPLSQQGIIESLPVLNIRPNEPIVFFLPIINQDVLSINPIESMIEQILCAYPHALIFCDISLFLSTLTQAHLESLRLLKHKKLLFMCNAEHIGLMRKCGFILSELSDGEIPALKAYFDTQLLRPNLFKAAITAIEDILALPPSIDTKAQFFTSLQSHLKDDMALFVPYHLLNSPNALALRFKGIKARLLIESLQIAGIYAINGQDCLFGNAKPSFVLHSMGYDEPQCRELLSVSYKHLDDIESITSHIASAYLQLRQFHL